MNDPVGFISLVIVAAIIVGAFCYIYKSPGKKSRAQLHVSRINRTHEMTWSRRRGHCIVCNANTIQHHTMLGARCFDGRP